MSVFQIIGTYREAFAKGLLVTVQLSAIIWVGGLILGFLLGSLGSRIPTTFGRIVAVGSFLLSGLPILVLLFWLHYPLQAMMKVVIDPFVTSALALTVVNAFGVAQLVRGAIDDFPVHYVMAAKVAGLSPWQTLRHIKAPILLRQLIPVLLTSQVVMLQATLFASLISVEEIFRVAQRINSLIYKPIEIYSALGLFFLLVCLPLNGFSAWLKNRFTRNLSET